jgi:hypothetical protein
MEDQVYRVKNVKFLPFRHRHSFESTDLSDCERILEGIRSQIIMDNFYFCYRSDLTLNCERKKMNPGMGPERRYFWNEELLKVFARHRLPQCWRIPVVQGFVGEVHLQCEKLAYLYINVSRRSKFMAGTILNCTGIDHNFNVANFVETEEVLMCRNVLFSHVSLRGSAPLFWEQSGASICFKKELESDNELVMQKHYKLLSEGYNA